jgi:oxalate decarboxylase
VRFACFKAGGVGYVPQGYGHYIEDARTDDPDLLIVVNIGSYQSIWLSVWLAANPHPLLATNFEVPERTFANFPTQQRFMPG